jgi:hypothetical protein
VSDSSRSIVKGRESPEPSTCGSRRGTEVRFGGMSLGQDVRGIPFSRQNAYLVPTKYSS